MNFSGLLETFAALARRRTLASVSSTNASNTNANNAQNTATQNNQNASSLFPRAPSSVSSLVRLALSSNFPSGLLSTAQSYPSLSSSNNATNQTGGVSTTAGAVQGLSQALTMSLTSTSSDSEQVSLEDFLESCRAPTLLAEMDDDEEMGKEIVFIVCFYIYKNSNNNVRFLTKNIAKLLLFCNINLERFKLLFIQIILW